MFGEIIKIDNWKQASMVKRLFDIICSLIGLIIIFPALFIIAILIKIDSPGPALYKSERVGKDGKKFRVYKFRTMVLDAEKKGGWSTALHDPRLTKIGSTLRKYKIDELPQLINILKGEMSVVGPRPQVEEYTSRYTEEENIILSVKPGLTDYASIELINLDEILGDGNVDEKYMREIEPRKNYLRMKYAKKHSFWIDLKIIYFTAKKLWNTKG